MSRAGGGSRDLATQRAGHAVLAKLASLHAARLNVSQGVVTTVDELVPWAVGYVGEVRVGTLLAGLDGRWRVLHAIPLGRRGKDVDHLVVGPGGVFAINTKHHSGARVTVKGRDALYVNGTWKPYLKDARRDAEDVETLLAPASPVPVRAVICLVGSRLTVTTPGDAVDVLDADELPFWLMKQPEIVAADAVDGLYAQARRADTWPGTPVTEAPEWADALARDLAEQPPSRSAATASEPDPAEAAGGPTVPIPRRAPVARQMHSPPSASRTPTRRRSRRTSVGVRHPTGRHGADLLKGLLALAALAAIMFAGPDRIAGLLRPLIDSVAQRVTNDLPHHPGTDPALPSHAVGTACSVRDERARSILDGSPIQCLPLSTGGGLRWQPSKAVSRPSTVAPSR